MVSVFYSQRANRYSDVIIWFLPKRGPIIRTIDTTISILFLHREIYREKRGEGIGRVQTIFKEERIDQLTNAVRVGI